MFKISNPNKKPRKRTIFYRILVPMMLVVVVQLAVYLITLSAGGIFSTVKTDIMYNFSEKVKTRQKYLVNDMVDRWSNLNPTYSSVINIMDTYLEENG
ncbi:MAG: hypothetical protein RR827_08135, partial [Oscillospiraceae bacterium]